MEQCCVRCGSSLTGRQSKYCKISCKTADFNIRKRRANKLRAVALRGGCCQRCGYIGSALGWHHRDPSQKKGLIASSSWGWERYWREVEKCDLLCANCHMEEHANRV